MAKFLKDIVKPKSTKVTNDLGSYAPKSGDEQDFVKKHEIEKHDDRNGNGDDVFKGKTKYVLDKPEEKRHGYKKPEDAKVNESKKAEDVSCNHTPAGTKCPVHEMADCTGSKTIKEEDIDETMSAKQKQYANRVKTIPGKKGIVIAKSNFEAPVHKVHAVISKNGGAKETVKHELQAKDKHDAMFTIQMMHHKAGDKVHDTKYKGIKEEVEQIDEVWYVQHKDGSRTHHESGTAAMKVSRKSPGSKVGATHGYGGMKAADALKPKTTKEEVEQVDEVLTKSTTAGETIHDFVHSKNPKFAGKSKKERQRMALGAYYAKQREQKEEVSEDLAVPLLGGDPPRGDSEEAIEMVKSELKALANKAMHLVMQMPQGMHVEPWCQAKIAQAKSYVSDVHDYMIYGDHEDEKDEQMDTPLTFPNMSVDVNTGQNV